MMVETIYGGDVITADGEDFQVRVVVESPRQRRLPAVLDEGVLIPPPLPNLTVHPDVGRPAGADHTPMA